MDELNGIETWQCIICGEVFYDFPQYCSKNVCEKCSEELFDEIDQRCNQND